MTVHVDPLYIGKIDRPSALKVYCALWDEWLRSPGYWVTVDRARMGQLGLCRQALNQNYLWLERKGFIRRKDWDWRIIALNPLAVRIAGMGVKERGEDMLNFRPILPLLPDGRKA